MVKINKNIIDLKKAILIAFASICLSFLFAGNTEAQNFYGNINETQQTKEIHTSTYYSQKSIVAAAEMKNAVCNLKEMRESYQSSCYSCMVVKTLTEAFMKGCAKAYPIAKDAGSKIAIIGAIIWMVIFAMKNVSSFTSLEPANNINDILVFLFKVLVAIVFINTGIGVLVQYIVEPILIAGADYGMGIITSSTGFDAPSPEYTYDNEIELISTKSINKLFGLNQAIDKVVSENLVIGNALICHSMNAGAWVDASLWFVTLKIPSIWIMLCGAAIWAAGFMLTLSISYYVLDVSFKLGFAIMLLPVAIGLWPFEATKKKLSDLLSIIFKSAAIFAFLAITTSYSLNMISAAMGGVEEMYTRIENDDATWISQRFEITGSFFILIIFAYLYSLKMIGGTITSYVDKFFSDSVFGDDKDKSNPIHRLSTHATDIAKQKSVGLAKGAATLGGRAASAGAKGLVRAARGDETGGTTVVGNARKAVGRFAQFAGRKAEKLGDVNRKLSQNLQNFSDKQVAKGVGKKNIFNLAAGGLAGKMAAANANIPGIAKANGVSKSLGASLQKWGAKEEQKGRDFNANYRDVKGQVKNAVKSEIDLAKSAVNQGKSYVKGVVKDGVESIKDDAKQVGNAVKGTKVYQSAASGVRKVGDVAEKTGTALSNGYVAASTATKGAVVGAARKTAQTANEIGNKAVNIGNKVVDAGKRTAVYKAGKYTVNKSVQGATYVGSKTVQGAQFVKGATVDTVQRTKEAVVESSVYRAGEKTVQGIQTADRSIRDAAISVRSTIGGGVGATREFAQGINTSIKNKVGGAISSINNARKQAGAAINGAVYKGLGGEKLAEKLTGVKRNEDLSKEQTGSQDTKEEARIRIEEAMKREDAIMRELDAFKVDYSILKDPELDDKERFSFQYSSELTKKAKEYDTLAKNAKTEAEREEFKKLSEINMRNAKAAAMVQDTILMREDIIKQKSHEMDRQIYAKMTARNSFREKLSDKDKEIYDRLYEEKYLNEERKRVIILSETESIIRERTKHDLEKIQRARKLDISNAVISGAGYSYKTQENGWRNFSESDYAYNYVSVDALGEADLKLYNDIYEKEKKIMEERNINSPTDEKTRLDNITKNLFLSAKNDELLKNVDEYYEIKEKIDDNYNRPAHQKGISNEELKDLHSELRDRKEEIVGDDIYHKRKLENIEREIAAEELKQRGAEFERIKERMLKEEKEQASREKEAENNKAQLEAESKNSKTVENEAQEQNRKEKADREEKEKIEAQKEKEKKEEEKKKEAEREEKRKKEKEEQLKSEKEKKETDEKRQAEEEKRRKEDEDRKNQENYNRINFENEYSELIRKYNITDQSSVENLSAEQRQSLKDGIERLKSKYKQ